MLFWLKPVRKASCVTMMLIIKSSLIVLNHPWCLQRIYRKNPTSDNEKQVEFQWVWEGWGGGENFIYATQY